MGCFTTRSPRPRTTRATNPKWNAKYREFHFVNVSTPRDVSVGKKWIDVFLAQPGHFRCLVYEWARWDGKYFGDAFEPDALKKRRAYKKWCELLLQPELSSPLDGGGAIRGAELYLDRLRIAYGYDVIDSLRERFTPATGYRGQRPWISKFQHAASWRDAHQCLQLADLLVGCVKEELMPSSRPEKHEIRDHLADQLKPHGVRELGASFWRGYHPKSLRDKHPKFSAWFWQPERKRR